MMFVIVNLRGFFSLDRVVVFFDFLICDLCGFDSLKDV